MIQMARRHYIKSIEDSLEHIPEGDGRENIPGHIDETEVLTRNRDTYVDDASPEAYHYVDVELTYRTPTKRQLTYIGFWKQEEEDGLGKLKFSQWNVLISQPNGTEKGKSPIRHEGSPQAISLRGLRKIARTMKHSVKLFEAAGVDKPPVIASL